MENRNKEQAQTSQHASQVDILVVLETCQQLAKLRLMSSIAPRVFYSCNNLSPHHTCCLLASTCFQVFPQHSSKESWKSSFIIFS